MSLSNYRIFGSELSPYSVKVRSYFRYKGLPHEWLPRSPANQAEFQKYAKLPLVPLVVTPDEARACRTRRRSSSASRPPAREPSIVPDDPALAFLSALLEEYGDEWGNKWMFHYRWRYQPDCWSTAERIAQQMVGAQGALAVAQARAAVAERMTGRLGFVGSNDDARDRGRLIEASFRTRSSRCSTRTWRRGRSLLGGRGRADGRLRPVGPALRGRHRSDAGRARCGRTAAASVMAWVRGACGAYRIEHDRAAAGVGRQPRPAPAGDDRRRIADEAHIGQDRGHLARIVGQLAAVHRARHALVDPLGSETTRWSRARNFG